MQLFEGPITVYESIFIDNKLLVSDMTSYTMTQSQMEDDPTNQEKKLINGQAMVRPNNIDELEKRFDEIESIATVFVYQHKHSLVFANN